MEKSLKDICIIFYTVPNFVYMISYFKKQIAINQVLKNSALKADDKIEKDFIYPKQQIT